MRKTTRSVVIVFILVLLAAAPVMAEMITVKGSIQGLLMTIHGKKCEPGMEHIVAAVEDQFVLVDDKDGNWYVLPKFKPSQMAPYLNKAVKVEGNLIGKGKAIDVKVAHVYENGNWKKVYSEEIVKRQKALQKAIMTVPETPG